MIYFLVMFVRQLCAFTTKTVIRSSFRTRNNNFERFSQRSPEVVGFLWVFLFPPTANVDRVVWIVKNFTNPSKPLSNCYKVS